MSSSSPPSPTVRHGGRKRGGASSQSAGLAKAGEWERHRERITELYRDQGLHLDEVIAAMAKEHAFYAK